MEIKDLAKDSKPIATVYSTMDYEWFKFIDSNRKTDHVNALIVSMQERDVPNAILCNEKGEIIDGQNRFLARQTLGLPILYYCIEHLNIYDVAFLNSYAKNWSNQDFVDMWASLGIDEYIKIKKFQELFPDLPLVGILQILSDSISAQMSSTGSDGSVEKTGRRHNNKTSDLKSGRFKIKDWNRSIYVANCIMSYRPFGRTDAKIYKHGLFISAMVKLLRNKDFVNTELVESVSKHPDMFNKCINSDNYLNMLTDIYNYNRKKNRKNFYQMANGSCK